MSFQFINKSWNLQKLAIENKLIMVYAGQIKGNSHEHLMQEAGEKMDALKADKKNKKKVLNILLESVQNIAKHGVNDENNSVDSLFVVGKDDKNNFFVVSGNTIHKESELYLREKLDHYNSLSPEELRESFWDKLQNKDFSPKGGASLGFLDIIRKSNSKVNYHFSPVNMHHAFFSFKVTINIDNTSPNTVNLTS